MAKSKKKKPVRGSGISVSISTEPIAGAAKDRAVFEVMVQDEGELLLEYQVKEGNVIQFRVGGTVEAYMQRPENPEERAPVPDGDMYLDAAQGNVERVTIEYEHALAGPQKKSLGPGQRLTVNPVVSRHWKMTAPDWE